jgi:hypothetical protein
MANPAMTMAAMPTANSGVHAVSAATTSSNPATITAARTPNEDPHMADPIPARIVPETAFRRASRG